MYLKKEIVMKRIAAFALYVAAALIATGSALAQEHAVNATVPFSFTVNGNLLPAGNYTIGSDSTRSNVLSIRNRRDKVNIWALGMINPNNGGKTGNLLFHQYGGRYFLSEIQYPHSTSKVRFPASKAEKSAMENPVEAGLNVNRDVLIALN
jgi:hypothetical protein